MSAPRRTIPIQPILSLPGVEAAYKVQARATRGRFTSWRRLSLLVTQLFFFVLPWLNWHGRQMVRFDLEAQRFYLGSVILLPQDLIFLSGLLVFCAMGLFMVTTLWGRVWCGFACPQTVYTELFMWVERRFEGDRYQRIRLDQSAWGIEKLWRRGGKQLSWVCMALWAGLTFVGWFSPMREVAHGAFTASMGFWDAFWALFYGGFCYLNAGLLREKVCLHMCPYGRFQGALMDADTRIVAYDAARGEPRGAARQGQASAGQGACIDCTMCVQVCPTGIDIREGLQPACIACGLCIDACDQIMDRIGQPRGLVRLATQRQLVASSSSVSPMPTWARHRVRVYGGLMSALLVALVWTLWQRPDVRVDVIRDRGVMARVVEDGVVENVYRVQVMSQTDDPQSLRIGVSGLTGAVVQAAPVALGPVADRLVQVAVRLPAPQAQVLAGRTVPIRFEVASRSAEGSSLVSEPSTFVVPR
ncbi:cytochrome c oxidase accessory protein CcoG [Aquabacterium sp.]|uniref:cytochrome c oxidase accessory protein CcoG n=1 Tax=Aquabacterium sp. TaxID=1872578 RepID=UPI0025B87DFC|nr:cytochrome c oxidase accessory protein CcoG [Aquabacterium sp.]